MLKCVDGERGKVRAQPEDAAEVHFHRATYHPCAVITLF